MLFAKSILSAGQKTTLMLHRTAKILAQHYITLDYVSSKLPLPEEGLRSPQQLRRVCQAPQGEKRVAVLCKMKTFFIWMRGDSDLEFWLVTVMSEECVGKPCTVCSKTIQSANYYCPRCKACICFYCGAEILKEVNVKHLKCPRCGNKLE